MPKRSRLVRKISGPDFECIRKPDTNFVRKMTITIPDSPVFGGVLYIRKLDRLAFKWSSLGHFLCQGFKWSGNQMVGTDK